MWWRMKMQGNECQDRGIMGLDQGVPVGMRRRPRLGPRLARTHALYGPCVCRTGSCPPVCGRRTRAELHIQDMQPRMLPPSAAPRRGASCRHPCCSLPHSGLRAHSTVLVEAQGRVERGTGSVSSSFAGRKEERDRDRSSEGEAVVCRLLLQSRPRSGIRHSEFLSIPTTSRGSILSMGEAKCRIAPP